MKGLIIKDIMCLKKQLTIFAYVIVGVLVISVMYVLSARFGNIARTGEALLANAENGLTAIDVKKIGSLALMLFMLLPMATVCDMTNVFAADGKAGFYKVAGALPVSLKERLAARFATICALFSIGAVVDILIAFVLSVITDLIRFADFLGIIISAASMMSIYSAIAIFYCILLGFGKEQYAQLLSLATLIAGILLVNIKSVIGVVRAIVREESSDDISGLWRLTDFIMHKSYILFIIAVCVSMLSFAASCQLAERKRGVI